MNTRIKIPAIDIEQSEPLHAIRAWKLPAVVNATPEILYVSEGQSIEQIMHSIKMEEAAWPYVQVKLNGYLILQDQWKFVRPKPDYMHTLEIRFIGGGGGGGGGGLLRTLGIVAVAAIAVWISGGAALPAVLGGGSLLTAGSFSALALAAGVSLVGNLLINALAPLPKQQSIGTGVSEGQIYSIGGARNEATQYSFIQKILGKRRLYPRYAMKPYTLLEGDDQFAYMLFEFEGHVDIEAGSVKLGETPITEYSDVETNYIEDFQTPSQLQIVTNSIDETAVGATIGDNDTFDSRVADSNLDEFQLDIVFSGGLNYADANGNPQSLSIPINLQFTDTTLAVLNDVAQFHISAAQRKPKRVSVIFKRGAGVYGVDTSHANEKIVPDVYGTASFVLGTFATPDKIIFYIDPASWPVLNQFTIDVSSGYPYVTGSVPANEAATLWTGQPTPSDRWTWTPEWTVLRAIKYESPVSQLGVALYEMKIRATEQLNGFPDEFNFVGTSKELTWTGAAWSASRSATRNPAALLRSVLLDATNGNPMPLSGIHDTGAGDTDAAASMAGFYEWCDTMGFNCDMVVNDDVRIEDLIQDIAAAGRARIRRNNNGQLAVVIDRTRSEKHQWFTPRDIQSLGLTKTYKSVPEALRVIFPNEERGYQDDEIVVYRSDKSAGTATRYDQVRLENTTTPVNAWKRATYDMAVLENRQHSIYTLKLGPQAFAAPRGALIGVTHDAIQRTVAFGKIVSIVENGGLDAVSITLDAEIDLVGTIGISIRRQGIFSIFETTGTVNGSNSQQLDFDAVIPAPHNLSQGDTVSVGPVGTVSKDLIVANVRYGKDYAFELECYSYQAATVYAVDSATPPTIISDLDVPVSDRPSRPAIRAVVSDETVVILASDGTLIPRILVSFDGAVSFENQISGYEFRWRIQGDSTWTEGPLVPPSEWSFFIDGIADGDIVEFQVRSREEITGRTSDWSILQSETVVGQSTLPPDATGLQVILNSDGFLQATWLPPIDPPLDFAGYFLKHIMGITLPASEANWVAALDFVPGLITQTSVFRRPILPSSQRQFLLRSVDRSGNLGNIVAIDAPITPLDAATGFQIIPFLDHVTYEMQFPNNSLASRYQVFARTDNTTPQEADIILDMDRDSQGSAFGSISNGDLTQNVDMWFYVRLLDKYGNQTAFTSNPSNPVRVRGNSLDHVSSVTQSLVNDIYELANDSAISIINNGIDGAEATGVVIADVQQANRSVKVVADAQDASFTVVVDNNGVAGGFKLGANGATVDAVFAVDTFFIGKGDGSNKRTLIDGEGFIIADRIAANDIAAHILTADTIFVEDIIIAGGGAIIFSDVLVQEPLTVYPRVDRTPSGVYVTVADFSIPNNEQPFFYKYDFRSWRQNPGQDTFGIGNGGDQHYRRVTLNGNIIDSDFYTNIANSSTGAQLTGAGWDFVPKSTTPNLNLKIEVGSIGQVSPSTNWNADNWVSDLQIILMALKG